MVSAPFSLATDPSQLSGFNSGNNLGGSSLAGFLSPSPVYAMGGASNPFAASTPSGTTLPGLSSPSTSPGVTPTSISAYTSPYSTSGATDLLAKLGPGGSGGNIFGLQDTQAQRSDIAQGLQHAGFSGGTGTALAAFLMSGAGYNPAVAQALIAALQPQFAQGQANIMEQFGSMGLAASSPAALGLGGYEAQTNLDVGTILAGLYEQSVQNYMNVLMGGKGPPQSSLLSFEGIASGVSQLAGAAAAFHP